MRITILALVLMLGCSQPKPQKISLRHCTGDMGVMGAWHYSDYDQFGPTGYGFGYKDVRAPSVHYVEMAWTLPDGVSTKTCQWLGEW